MRRKILYDYNVYITYNQFLFKDKGRNYIYTYIYNIVKLQFIHLTPYVTKCSHCHRKHFSSGKIIRFVASN